MKDFYDLWVLSERFLFERAALAAAIRATFERRGTALPPAVPPGLSDALAADPLKAVQWTAFLRRDRLGEQHQLAEVVSRIREFIMPEVVAGDTPVDYSHWPPEGPWRT